MLITTLLCRLRIPFNRFDLLLNRNPLECRDIDTGICYYTDLPIVHEDDISRVLEDPGYVGRYKKTTTPESKNKWTILPRYNDPVRIVSTYRRECVRPANHR